VKFKACPTRPVTHVAPLIVPFRLLPELSERVVPVPPAPTHAPTRPGGSDCAAALETNDGMKASEKDVTNEMNRQIRTQFVIGKRRSSTALLGEELQARRLPLSNQHAHQEVVIASVNSPAASQTLFSLRQSYELRFFGVFLLFAEHGATPTRSVAFDADVGHVAHRPNRYDEMNALRAKWR
jgi:hypothetical protein